MYLSVTTAIIGILLMFAGASGFVPTLVHDDLLYNVFYIDNIHNTVNFLVGIIAVISALNYKSDRTYLRVFGILFGLLAITGFVTDGYLIITRVNLADSIAHLVIAATFLILGFSADKEGFV